MKIKLSTKDWLWNAGLVGFYNILNQTEEVKIENNELIFEEKVLKNFSIKYFNYLIEKYKPISSFQKLIDIQDFLKEFKFEENQIELLNEKITFLKSKVKLNSFINTYDYIEKGTKEKILNLEKEIKKVTKKETEEVIKEKIEKMKKIIELINKTKEVKNYVAAKNIAYTIINRAYNNVAFFNPSKVQNDIYEEYDSYFVKPAIEYLKKVKTTNKFEFICDLTNLKTKYSKKSLAFLNQVGYDVQKKTSHAWNHVSQVVISDLAILILSCIPAGFNYVYENGIFINSNESLEELIRINNAISYKILKLKNKNFIESLIEVFYDFKYEASDIQIVRLENLKYKFSLISKRTIKILLKNQERLKMLNKKWYLKNNDYFYIYDEIIKCIIQNENILKQLHYYINLKIRGEKTNISTFDLSNVLEINCRNQKRRGRNMEEKDLYYIRRQGIEFRKKYLAKSQNENKLKTLIYKLTESLRSEDSKTFLDTLLSGYLYLTVPIDSQFIKLLAENKEIGYAFVIGLLGENKKEKGEENEK